LTYIGKSVPRSEDLRLITGAGRFTDDIRLPGELHARFVRSPYPHARVVAIDPSAARNAAGVVAVLTVAEYQSDGGRPMAHSPNPADAIDAKAPAFIAGPAGLPIRTVRPYPLADGRVRHAGEAVAMVVAESAAAARDAAELVDVTYDPLLAVANALDALDENAPLLWDEVPDNLVLDVAFGAGDVDAARAIAGAEFTVEYEFVNQRIAGAQLEPRVSIGSYDPVAGYTLVAGTQGVTRHQSWIAETLGVPADQVRVQTHDVGGSFGIRQFLHPEDVLVVWAARRLGRPVRWTADRSEDFVADYQGRDITVQAAIGVDGDGRVRGLRLSVFGNLGAYPVNLAPLQNYERIATTVYDIPVAHVRIYGVLTNTVPTVPFRGAGRPEATFTIERLLDIAAGRLGLDRLAIRRRNLIPHDRLPYTTQMGLTYDSGDFVGNMDRACTLAAWDRFPDRRAASERRGRLRGIGVANYIEAPVGAPRERVRVRVLPQGSVEIVTGTQSSGQGHETAFAQVVADKLDVPFETIGLVTGDTRMVAVGGGSHSNRSMRIVGTLLVDACADLIAQAHALAPGATVFAAAKLAGPEGLVCEKDFFGRIPAHPTGAAVCEVEIDPLTGETSVCGYAQIDDVGQAINPMIVEGQTHGGIAQGLGQALYEGVSYDPESGALYGSSFMQYAAPRAHQLPPFAVELVEDPTPSNPLRVKGGGEGGVTPSPAAAVNAVCDALRPYGVEHVDTPLFPAKLWAIMGRKT
jgi:aerobic carbon-monoxide dehydrogenase large subunit